MSSWAEIPEKGNGLFLTVLRLLVRRVPRRFLHPVARLVACFFLLIDSRSRTNSKQFLKKAGEYGATCLSGVPLINVVRHFSLFAFCVLDKCYAWTGRLDFPDCEFYGNEEFVARIYEKKGSILLGAHFGNIEVLRAIGKNTFDYKINALMYNANATRYNQTLKALNSESHTRVIEIDQAGPELIFDLQNRLEAGEIVSMLGDRLTPGAPGKSYEISFLGAPAKFPMGPFLLAAMLEHPIYTAFPVFSKGRYEAYFEKITLTEEIQKMRSKKKAEAIAKQYVAQLERYVTQYPYNWFNFYDFWK